MDEDKNGEMEGGKKLFLLCKSKIFIEK